MTLYDSDSFAVVHLMHDAAPDDANSDAAPVMHGFEILDKRAGRGIYLDGAWAEIFQARIAAWQRDTPTQEEVEDTLEGYAALAQNPLVLH